MNRELNVEHIKRTINRKKYDTKSTVVSITSNHVYCHSRKEYGGSLMEIATGCITVINAKKNVKSTQSDRVSGLSWRNPANGVTGGIVQSDGVMDGVGRREMQNGKEESD